MCGIYGAIGRNIDMNKLGILCLLNQTRGADSTGFWDGVRIRKGAIPACTFLPKKQKRGTWNAPWVHIGHTRFATRGEVTRANAHPLFHGKVVGVHNGSVWNFDTLITKYGLANMEVDSHVLWYLLDTKGLDGLKEVSGYGAIAWQKVNERAIWLATFNNGELYYARDNDAMYFASERNQLVAALGTKVRINKVSDNKAILVKQNLKIKRVAFTVKEGGAWYGLDDAYYSTWSRPGVPSFGASYKRYSKYGLPLSTESEKNVKVHKQAWEEEVVSASGSDTVIDTIREQEERNGANIAVDKGTRPGATFGTCAYCQGWELVERDPTLGELLCYSCEMGFYEPEEDVLGLNANGDTPPEGSKALVPVENKSPYVCKCGSGRDICYTCIKRVTDKELADALRKQGHTTTTRMCTCGKPKCAFCTKKKCRGFAHGCVCTTCMRIEEEHAANLKKDAV